MEHYYQTKDYTFTTRTAKRGEGYYVRSTYWRRPNKMRNKVEVSSMMDSLGYKGGRYFVTKEKATLNIKPFQMHTKELHKTHSTRGDGGSSTSYRKV